MKKIIALFFAVLFTLFAFSCAAAAVDEEDPVPSTSPDPWVELVSDVAGDELAKHEDSFRRDMNFAERFVERLKSFFETLREAFFDVWDQLVSIFGSIKDIGKKF